MNANKLSKKIRLLGKFISVGKFFLIIFSVIFVGFVGGAFSPFFVGWFKANRATSYTDAISSANTYIVFVTLIFIIVTVLVTIAAYIFSTQIVHSKLSMERDFVEEIAEKLNHDDEWSIELAKTILENRYITEHISEAIEKKVSELCGEHKTNSSVSQEDVSSIAGELS